MSDDKEEYKRRCCCWWCGGDLIWDNDFTSDDVFGDGEDRLVTYLHCTNPKCGAEVQYVQPTEDEVNGD